MTTFDLIKEPHDLYNEKRDQYLTASSLKDFAKSPELCRARRAGEIPQTRKRSFDLGAAAHKLILEGREAFEAEYVVTDGPINPDTGNPYGEKTKAYQAWLDDNIGNHLTILSTADAVLCERMEASVRGHAEARNLLTNGEPEGVIRTEIDGVACQVRMDWVSWDEGLTDLKTITDLDSFTDQYTDFDYGLQAGFYALVFERAAGYRPPFSFVVVEKQEPFRTGVFRVSDSHLDEQVQRALDLVRAVADCERSGRWPTNYEEVRVIG